MIRKLYLFTILLVVLFPSCGTKKTASLDRKITITFWHAMGGPLGDALKTMVKEFEEANPDVAIQLVSMANYSSLSQKLMGAVQVNAPPHLAQMYESWTTQFYTLNKLVVIDSLIHSPDGLTAEEVADFYPAFIEGNTWNGKIVTLPFNKSLPVFFYNIDLLAQQGYHEFPRDWEGLRALLRMFTDRKTGRYGGAGIVNEGVFGALLLQQGGDYLDEENKKALFNSPAGVRAAQLLATFVNEDSTVYYGAGYEPQNDFLAGKIACIQSTSVSWAFLKPNFSFKVGIAPLPVTGSPAVIGYGTNIGIFRTGTAEQTRAAWRFVKWFTSPEQQTKWAALTCYVPVRKSALKLPEYQKLIKETPDLEAALKQLDYLRFEPRSEAWFAGRRILGDALEKIIRAGVDPKKALDEAATEVEKELKK